MGAHNITDMGVGTDTVRMPISKIINHELFNPRMPYFYDISLIKLNEPVEFNTKIFPICIATETDDFEGKDCYYAGWGHSFSSYLICLK